MSSRTLWAVSLALALLGWVGLIYFTGGIPPQDGAALVALLLLAVAVGATAAPLVWLIGRGLHVAVIAEHPAAALRIGGWLGLWSAAALGMQLFKVFNWVLALTLALVLGLLESFLQQAARERPSNR